MPFLFPQENLQRHAFEQLMLQQDTSHCRIQSQIAMIEKELSQLTKAEIQQKEMKIDMQKVNY